MVGGTRGSKGLSTRGYHEGDLRGGEELCVLIAVAITQPRACDEMA